MDFKFKNDKHLEERIVQALIVDHKFAEQMFEILNPDYFNLGYLKDSVKIIFDYYGSYKAFPSYSLLWTIISKDIEDEMSRSQLKAYLLKIKQEPLNGDMEYIKEYALDYCRKRKLAIALENSLDLIEAKKYDQVYYEVYKALQAGSERDIGHMFLDKESFDSRMAESNRIAIPTPWPELNRIMNGGTSAGELSVIAALTGIGKSHFLVDLGVGMAMRGKNVVHYTFEMGEGKVGNRYDARISGIKPEKLVENKDSVLEAINKVPGKILIKSYPIRAATALTIKNHLNKLLIAKDFKPDIIIVDYADLMKSSKNYDQKRLEEESIYEELRALAQEINIPIWTATQINRAGSDVEVITLKYISECFAKAMIADLFLTMNRQKDSDMPEMGNIFVAKNRMGDDGIIFPMSINTGLSKITILPSSTRVDQDDEGDEKTSNPTMERAKKIFRDMQNKDEN